MRARLIGLLDSIKKLTILCLGVFTPGTWHGAQSNSLIAIPLALLRCNGARRLVPYSYLHHASESNP